MHFLALFITVKTPAQLDELTMQTYIMGAIVGVVFLVIAAIIASVIKYQGGANSPDPKKRRMWFWTLLFASFITFFLYNKFSVSSTVAPNLQPKFMTVTVIGSVIALVTYLIVGFVLSKMFSTGKLGNWFPSKK